MTPGATTGPGENRENLDRRAGETSNHGEQVRHTRNFCTGLTQNDSSFRELTEEYHQGKKTKDQLREEFKKRLKGSTAEQRNKMGLTSATADATDAEVEKFLSDTKCFDNQLLAHIQNDVKGKEKAHENMVENCIEVARDEYGSFDENELKQSLKKEENSRLRTFLEVPKYRKTYIKKLPGGHTLTDKNFGDVDFSAITQSIATLDPTNPKRREIQEAWLKISQVAAPESNLAEAFSSIAHGGGAKFDIAGAYGAFFSDENTLVSRENREKILNFLTQQYTPIVPLGVLEVLDPKSHKKFLTSEPDKTEIERDLPSDPELATALKQDRLEQWEKTYKQYIGGGKNMIGSRTLPFETKIKLISQFGSIGKAEKMLAYYRGKPGSLRSSTNGEEGFRDKFKATYDLDPEELDTKSGLTEQLIARLGHRVEGIENFDAGCAMQWKTKDKDNTEITGYYIIDSVPGDTLDEENILTVRFLGNSRDTLSPGGLARHYTGADFYNYLDGCADDGLITFRKRSEFDTEIENNTKEKKNPRYPTDAETKAELRNQFSETIEVQDFDQLNLEIDQLINPKGDNKKEAKSSKERALHEGMIFCKLSEAGLDTFQVKEIDKEGGTITLWDGWGTGKKSVKELSFHEFLLTLKGLKKASKELYRPPTGGKAITINQFNILCGMEEQYDDNLQNKMKKVTIREEDGKNIFGITNPKTGVFTASPVVKVGDKQDLYIESIDGSTVTYRCGTFKQGVFDKEKDTWTQKTDFSGSPERTMSLEMLWAYLQNNQHFELDKPIEKAERKEQKEKDTGMSWWNILKHTHSLGVIMHGDLWKAPFKAWEEQHHKDHDFAGKITAALAIEKLDSGGGITGWAMNKMEWPSLMVADGNGSFQSYLNELVEKVDGMGSYHRSRLIKKWSKKEHFPSPKFMAAIMASMKIFGQLYPYDGGGDEYKSGGSNEWFWYNSICHSIDPNHGKYPHMPPHEGEEWPKVWTKEGLKMNEIDVLYEVFNNFKHPMLKNLGRRFQKYMNAGQTELEDGGKGNLNQRTTMEEKLDWMMGTAVSSKLPEMFGGATELWLTEGYSTEISSMPYAAVLFGCREEQMLGPTREHIKQQFQSGYHMPHFVFMQNKDFGDVFRDTGIAFAYTISPECGKELEEITNDARSGRLSGSRGRKWRDRFQKFWKNNGKELMHKLSGMRDPMLNLMINDPALFDELLEHQPEEKKKQYKILREKKSIVRAYYQRLRDTYGDATAHAVMDRNKGYYAGDHFRFRDGFNSGTPIAWINWDNYIDPNIDEDYAANGKATKGDGVFNEMRGFLYAIPKLAEKMADQMGFKGNKSYIDRIAKSLFEKNRDPMKRLMEEKIDATKPSTEYVSMTATMLEIIPPQLMSVGGATPEEQARYKKYFEQIKGSLKIAKKIENEKGYAAALTYRSEMATKWSEIVKGQIVTDKLSLDQIHRGDFDGDDELSSVKNNVQARSGTILTKKLDEFDNLARKGESATTPIERTATESDDLGLAA